jgi:hypothetical protein
VQVANPAHPTNHINSLKGEGFNMMSDNAMPILIDKIRGITREIEPVLTIGDKTFYRGDWKELHESMPARIAITTLTGLIEFLQSGLAECKPSDAYINVTGPLSLVVVSAVPVGSFKQIRTFIQVAAPSISNFTDGHEYGLEEFNILLQSQFEPSEIKDKILSIVGNIVDEESVQVMDDGVTQRVAAKSGIVFIQREDVPNPVELIPYWTFLELEQPKIPFVLRVKKHEKGKYTCSLTEAGGGRWTYYAVEQIAEHLKRNLPEWKVIR